MRLSSKARRITFGTALTLGLIGGTTAPAFAATMGGQPYSPETGCNSSCDLPPVGGWNQGSTTVVVVVVVVIIDGKSVPCYSDGNTVTVQGQPCQVIGNTVFCKGSDGKYRHYKCHQVSQLQHRHYQGRDWVRCPGQTNWIRCDRDGSFQLQNKRFRCFTPRDGKCGYYEDNSGNHGGYGNQGDHGNHGGYGNQGDHGNSGGYGNQGDHGNTHSAVQPVV